MDMIKRTEELKKDLQDKEVRDSFVLDHINIGIPLQIRALREQKGRGWTQQELANRAGMKQERISAIENPNYKNAFTLSTLTRLASAFDVALIVRFVPISELVKWELTISPEKLEAVSFNDDPYFKPPVYEFVAQGGMILGGSGIVDFINPSKPSMPLEDEFTRFKRTKEKEAKKEMEDREKQEKIKKELGIQMQKAMIGAQ
ncbi:MAG: helix-turn-helix domain-containing protein [Thermodesulfobacteriota bacterium]